MERLEAGEFNTTVGTSTKVQLWLARRTHISNPILPHSVDKNVYLILTKPWFFALNCLDTMQYFDID